MRVSDKDFEQDVAQKTERRPFPERHGFRAVGSEFSTAVADVIADGHGFAVETFGEGVRRYPCPFCGQALYPAESWFCEVTMEVITPATDTGCECSWCLINRNGMPGRGRPRKHCGGELCRREYERQRKQVSREMTKGRR